MFITLHGRHVDTMQSGGVEEASLPCTNPGLADQQDANSKRMVMEDAVGDGIVSEGPRQQGCRI
jgi:hypothetical protein